MCFDKLSTVLRYALLSMTRHGVTKQPRRGALCVILSSREAP